MSILPNDKNEIAGQLSISGSTAVYAVSASFDVDNGAKTNPTLADPLGSVSYGALVSSGQFEVRVPISGSQHRWIDDVKIGKPVAARFKEPTLVHNLGVVLKKANVKTEASDRSIIYGIDFVVFQIDTT